MNDRFVLAIDTSFGPVSAALANSAGEIVAHFEADNVPGTQAETLPPRIAEMFSNAGVRFDRLDRIAVTVGPGAFTGVRVGLAFAKGLKVATRAIVLGFSTLECLASQAARNTPGANIAVAIDAKRAEIYLQIFDAALEPVTEGVLLPVELAADVVRTRLASPAVFTGSGAALVHEAFSGQAKIDPIARIDTQMLAQRAIVANPQLHAPVAGYLRAPDARLPA